MAIVEAKAEDFVGLRLRDEDQYELNCLGLDPVEALRVSLAAGQAWVWKPSEVACAWGVVRGAGIEPSSLWLLTTPLIDQHKIHFARRSREIIAGILAEEGCIDGYVLVRNKRSVRWLAWLGFSFGPELDLTPVGKVRRFEKWL